MTVSTIKPHPRRRGYYEVAWDHHEPMLVHEDVIVALGLRVGAEVASDLLERIVHEQQVAEAREAALRLLKVRGRSRQELRARLSKKGFGRDAVDEGMAKLENMGLINDVQFASDLARSSLRRQQYGRQGLLYKLRAGGVTAEVAEAVVGETLEGADETERAVQVLQQRLERWRGLTEWERRAKAHQYLARLGYEADTIADALNVVLADE